MINDLIAEFETFCNRTAPVTLAGLGLAQLGRFLALVPREDSGRLNDMAALAVKNFDKFRAPLTATELARRNNDVTSKQYELLIMWGYPYVMEEFRFHMTLTGKLPKAHAASARRALSSLLEPVLPIPFYINTLSLMGEDTDGMFHQIRRASLNQQN